MTDWSDPKADPKADIARMAVASSTAGVIARAYGATFDPNPGDPNYQYFFGTWDPPIEPLEPEGGWVVPPTCRCDMNLCRCNTPDPGQSFDEYHKEMVEEMMVKFGYSYEQARIALRPLVEAFQKVANSIARISRQLLAVHEAESKKRRPPHAGPPPPPLPIKPLRSVHTPLPTYNRAARGPR